MRSIRLSLFALCAVLPLAAVAATNRICSVYVESYASLQKQLFLGAEVFKAPQLGAMPMMLTMALPGAAQINPDQPVALHIFDIGEGKPVFILEVTPVGAADAYLQAIVGNETTLPEPVAGVYTFAGGAARIAGTRILFAPEASHLEACAGKDAPALPPLPDVPGTIRVTAAPVALATMIQSAREKMKEAFSAMGDAGMPNAEQSRKSMEAIIDFYSLILRQMESLQIGITVQREGLVIHSRLVPVKDSDIASLLASAKPVTPDYLAFLDEDALLRFASGSYSVPDGMRKQIIDLYAAMIRLSPNLAPIEPTDIVALIEPSLRAFGAPMAFTVNCRTNAILAHGMMGIPQPETYLNDQLALLTKPVFTNLMQHSGVKQTKPTVRTYKQSKIHTFNTVLDEEAFKKVLKDQMPVGLEPEAVEEALQSGLRPVRAMMKLFEPGYEYAAVGQALAFGMGSPAMVEQVIDRIGSPAKPSAEADRIAKLLAPSAPPCAIGRLSVSGISQMVLTMSHVLPEEGAAALPTGDGILFAKWAANGQAASTVLITTSEITSLTAIFQAASQAQGMKAALEGDDEDDLDEAEDMDDDEDRDDAQE